MAWQMFKATYELRSPLHIGYHKVGNVQRTRYYVPARNLWGAVTEVLTRKDFASKILKTGSSNDYLAVGDWVRAHCAFGYWFVMENGDSLFPHYSNRRWKYGPYDAFEFERRYLTAHVMTALDPLTTFSEKDTLHEVEFISAFTLGGARTLIGGIILLDEEAFQYLGTKDKWDPWLGHLSVGGERKYGFGQLRLINFESIDLLEDGYSVYLFSLRPHITVDKGRPLLAHAIAQGVDAKGQIEPLVWRQTLLSSLFGKNIKFGALCWVPGAIVTKKYKYEITGEGLWKITNQM